MTPTVRIGPASVDVVAAIRLKGRRSGQRVLAADDDGQAGAVDVLVQQAHHPLFLFHHLEQRAQRVERHRRVGASASSDEAPSTWKRLWSA